MKFHLGDVLSVTTGLLVAPDGISAIYSILNFMTGDNLFTHQLPRAGEQCKPALLFQHPQLRDETGDDLTKRLASLSGVELSSSRKTMCMKWLDEKVALYGEWLEVQPLNAYTPVDPIAELEDKFQGDIIIAAANAEERDE